MSYVYPEMREPTDGNPGKVGEWIVYQQFKNLKNDWIVIHSTERHLLADDGSKYSYHDYEADFIVLTEQGIVVVEVKNWTNPSIKDGRTWCTQRGEEYKDGSPLRHAFLVAQQLFKEMKKFMGWSKIDKKEYRSLAILVGASENYESIKHCESDRKAGEYLQTADDEVFKRLYIFGTEDLKRNLENKIQSLFVNAASLTESERLKIRDWLLYNIRFNMDLKTCRAIMDSAAAGAANILASLADSKIGIHVSGCAGSGKTWMACREIKRIATSNADAKVLFLCYNHNLANLLRNSPLLSGIDKNDFGRRASVEISTYSAAYTNLLKWQGIKGTAGDQNDEWLALTLEYVRKSPQFHYDYVFVDEAQDFKPEWEYIVRAMVKEITGKLYTFADTNQNINRQQNSLNDLPTCLRLTKNLRNAYDIAKYGANVLGNDELEPLDLPAKKVCVSEPLTDWQLRASRVKEYIADVLDNSINEKRGIVVLSPYNAKGQSSFDYLEDMVYVPTQGEDAKASERRHNRWRGSKADKVLGETIRSFKGLEADYVILTDMPVPSPENKAFSTDDFYVACTRAKFGLYIIPANEQAAKYARSMLPSEEE